MSFPHHKLVLWPGDALQVLTRFISGRADDNVYMLDYLLSQPASKADGARDVRAIVEKAFDGAAANGDEMLEDEDSNEDEWIGLGDED